MHYVSVFFSFPLQMLNLDEELQKEREVLHMDIAYDEIAEKYYKKEEVCMFKEKVKIFIKIFNTT